MSRPDGGGVATSERADEPAESPPPERGHTRTRLVIAAIVVLAVVLLVAVTAWGRSSSPVPAPSAPVPLAGAPTVPGSPPSASVAPIAPVAASAPLRVHVPAIAAESSLDPVGVDARNEVAVPPVSQPMQAAWYRLGPTPGAIGPAVVLGHVNGNGRPGIFANLDKLRPGQQVSVDRADGTTAVFTVRRSTTVDKASFPTQAVYGNTPGAELRLITCGGDFDAATRNYQSNVVVFADLTGMHRT